MAPRRSPWPWARYTRSRSWRHARLAPRVQRSSPALVYASGPCQDLACTQAAPPPVRKERPYQAPLPARDDVRLERERITRVRRDRDAHPSDVRRARHLEPCEIGEPELSIDGLSCWSPCAISTGLPNRAASSRSVVRNGSNGSRSFGSSSNSAPCIATTTAGAFAFPRR